jgi:sortase (surface protein transpeptidase)
MEWLENNIGLPEEFAIPGSGPSILAGHNHLNTAEAGPFALLRTLTENARVFITDSSNKLMSFSVFANAKIAADDMAEAERLSASCENALILITCEDEKAEGGYASRRIIAAKPVLLPQEQGKN